MTSSSLSGADASKVNADDAADVVNLLTDEEDDQVSPDLFVRDHFSDVCTYKLVLYVPVCLMHIFLLL